MSPRTRTLVIGSVSFLAVFALIVGAAIVFVAVQASGSGTKGSGEASETLSVDTTVPSTDGSASSATGQATPTETAAFCWSNSDRTSRTRNTQGTIRSSRIQVTIPEGWREIPQTTLTFADDTDSIAIDVEDTWISMVSIGELTWQTGYEYPGADVAAQRIMDCTVSDASLWDGSTQKRHVEDAVGAPVEIDGMTGYKATATLVFDQSRLTTTTGSYLTVIVLDTDQGPAVYYSDIARGVPAIEAAGPQIEASIQAV